MKLTTKELEGVLLGIVDKPNTTHLAIHVDEMAVFAEKIARPLHNVDDLQEILELRQEVASKAAEIERLKKSILQLIEAGDGLIKNNGHLPEAYHQAKSGWYRAKHTTLIREQGDE